MYVSVKNNMELSMKKTRSADFCADRIDVIVIFDVIKNVVIKRAHCIFVFMCCFSFLPTFST